MQAKHGFTFPLSALLLGLSLGASAEPAVYRDGMLHIDAGVLLTDVEPQYYHDIALATDSDGRLQVVAATELPLVHIDSVDAVVVENDMERSVTLEVAGYKSVPCVNLAEVAISRSEQTFTVVIAETLLGPAETCIAVTDPFEIEVDLDVTGLEPGNYEVVVNDVESVFELEQPVP